jgi:hypothetical protein
MITRLILRTLLAVLLLPALVPSSAPAAGRKTVTIIPENAKSVPVTIGGKARTYYLLGAGSPLRIEVDGPGKLTITSRLLVPAGSAGSEAYTLDIMEGTSVLKSQDTQSGASDATVSLQGFVPAKARKSTYKVGEGSSSYQIRLRKTTRDAVVRITFQPSKRSGAQTTLQPLSYDRVVTCLVKEKLIAYYVASEQRDVQLRVVGPTKVSVATRLSYDKTMKGNQKYAVIVREGTAQVVQKALSTTKSVGVEYKEWKEVVPGKVVSFDLSVPSGEHTYHVTLGQSQAHSVALKFSIPTKDLDNEN